MYPKHNQIVKEEIEKVLEFGIIEPPSSAWSIPVVIASKKHGKPRFCVDFQTLNQFTKTGRWSFPNIEKILGELEGSQFFITLDLFSGYCQIKMEDSCKEMTSFLTRYGTF